MRQQQRPRPVLVITQPLLQSLLASTQSLSLLSYSSIALYGSGQIGGVAVDGSGKKAYQETSLALHADDIFYADTQNSSGITINAQTVSLDNLANGTLLPSLTGLGGGDLTVNAQTITLGSNAMRIDQFTNVALNADAALLLKGLGTTLPDSSTAPTAVSLTTPTAASLTTSGNLTLTTPLLTSATVADQPVSTITADGTRTTALIDEAIIAAGSLVLQAPAADVVSPSNPGMLAASLALTGSNINQKSGKVVLHSGSLSLTSNGPTGSPGATAVAVNGTLDVSGVAATYYNLNKFTDGGQVTLSSFNGNVSLGAEGLIDVSAASGVGTVDSGAASAGGLTVHAAGLFTPGQINGAAGVVTELGAVIAQGKGGAFSVDVGSLDVLGVGDGQVSSIETGLTGFTSQTIRDRNDPLVTLDGTVKSADFSLYADKGSLVVGGTVDASNLGAGGNGRRHKPRGGRQRNPAKQREVDRCSQPV